MLQTLARHIRYYRSSCPRTVARTQARAELFALLDDMALSGLLPWTIHTAIVIEIVDGSR